MLESEVKKLFNEEIDKFSEFFNIEGITLSIHNMEFSPGSKRERDVAWADIENRTVNLVRRCLKFKYEQIVALIRHEISHLVDPFVEEEGREQRADDIAFMVAGDKINYTRNNMQTIEPGRHPRPRNLHR